MQNSKIDSLIDAFCCLPSVGPKSAQRMVYHLLQRNRQGGLLLAHLLSQAMTEIGHCQCCRTFTEHELCFICRNPKRQNGQICIVESPANIPAIEATGQFSGRYFVLMGRLSPLDGIGPSELGLSMLQERLQQEQVTELILATNPTVEGEATAHYITQLCRPYEITVTRIAHGVPMGGELEFVDGTTLTHSFMGRQLVDY